MVAGGGGDWGGKVGMQKVDGDGASGGAGRRLTGTAASSRDTATALEDGSGGGTH